MNDTTRRLSYAGRVLRGIAGALLALWVGLGPALAQERPGGPVPQEPEEEETELRNELAAIFAATWENEEDETFFTLGVEYERRLTERFGIVGEIEYLFDADSWIVAAPFTYRPARGFKLFAGPGFERSKEEPEEEGEEGEGLEPLSETSTHFLFRVGAAYAVEFAERYSIGPTFSVDFVREHGEWAHSLVFGVTFGVGF